MPLNVLILGSGVAGPALALMLLRSSSSSSSPNNNSTTSSASSSSSSECPYRITIIERSPDLRTAGQQIDLRDHGIPIMRRLGFLEPEGWLARHRVRESGISFVDAAGRQKAMFRATDTEGGRNGKRQGASSEWEIMRPDLVRVLYNASLEEAAKMREEEKRKGAKGEEEEEEEEGQELLKYRFGIYATSIDEDDSGVEVGFSDGSRGRWDLVVGADGQGSRTRRMVFETARDPTTGETTTLPSHLRSLDLFIALYSVPRALALSRPDAETLSTSSSSSSSGEVVHDHEAEESQRRQKKQKQQKKKGNSHDDEILLAKVYNEIGQRVVSTRHGDRGPEVDPPGTERAQVYLAIMPPSPAPSPNCSLEALRRAVRDMSVTEQMALWADLFRDVGWITPRLLGPLVAGGEETTGEEVDDDGNGGKRQKKRTTDFYMAEIGQVKMDRWSTATPPTTTTTTTTGAAAAAKEAPAGKKGRVVLLGDAGYCPSPITGQGSTASLTGAYVLAGELSKHVLCAEYGNRDDDEGAVETEWRQRIPAALRGYEATLRPYVDKMQTLPPGAPGAAYPNSRWGIRFYHTVLGAITTLQVDKIVEWLLPETKGGLTLPEYPGLKF